MIIINTSNHFSLIFTRGLVSKKATYVNWDPVEKTVLANEQVVTKTLRSMSVERKKLSQWFLNISKYSDELLNDLDTLKGWPEKLKPKKLIGKSYGCDLVFNVTNNKNKIKVFTTRPDTIFGATFMALSPDHELSGLFKNNINFKKFKDLVLKQEQQRKLWLKRKKLVLIQSYVNHLIKNTKMSVILNFVLMDYGNGAIFGYPAHDQRDFDFATKYNLTIVAVV